MTLREFLLQPDYEIANAVELKVLDFLSHTCDDGDFHDALQLDVLIDQN